MIKFRKIFTKVGEHQESFAIITLRRVVTQFRTVEVAEDPEGLGRIRMIEERVRYTFVIDFWFFIIRFSEEIWLPNKQ